MFSLFQVAETILDAIVKPVLVETKFEDVEEVISVSNDVLYLLNVVDEDVDDYKFEFDPIFFMNSDYAIGNSCAGSIDDDVNIENNNNTQRVGVSLNFKPVDSKGLSVPPTTTTTTVLATPTFVNNKSFYSGGNGVESSEHISLRRKLYNYFHQRKLRNKGDTLYNKDKFTSTVSFPSRKSIRGSFKSFSRLSLRQKSSNWFNYSKQDVSFRPDLELESFSFDGDSINVSLNGSISSVLSVISQGSFLFDDPEFGVTPLEKLDSSMFNQTSIGNDINIVSHTYEGNTFGSIIPREFEVNLPFESCESVKSNNFSIRSVKPVSSTIVNSFEHELLKGFNQVDLSKILRFNATLVSSNRLRNLNFNICCVDIKSCGTLVHSITPSSTTPLFSHKQVSIPNRLSFSCHVGMDLLNQLGFGMGFEKSSGSLVRFINTTTKLSVIHRNNVSVPYLFVNSNQFETNLHTSTTPFTFVGSNDFVIPHKLGIQILKYFGLNMSVSQGNGTVFYGSTFVCHTNVTTFGFIISYYLGIKLIEYFGLDMDFDNHGTGTALISKILVASRDNSGFNKFELRVKLIEYLSSYLDSYRIGLVDTVTTTTTTTIFIPVICSIPHNSIDCRALDSNISLKADAALVGRIRSQTPGLYAIYKTRFVKPGFNRFQELELLISFFDHKLSLRLFDDDFDTAGSDNFDEDSSVSSFQSDIIIDCDESVASHVSVSSGIPDVTGENITSSKPLSDDFPLNGELFVPQHEEDFSDDYSDESSSEYSEVDYDDDSNFNQDNLEVTCADETTRSKPVTDSRSFQQTIELYFSSHYQSYLRSRVGDLQGYDGYVLWPYWKANGELDVIACSNDPENFKKYTTTTGAVATLASESNELSDDVIENIINLYFDREPIFGHHRWLPLRDKKPYVKSKLSECYTSPRLTGEATTTTDSESDDEEETEDDYKEEEEEDLLHLPSSQLKQLYQLEEGSYKRPPFGDEEDYGFDNDSDEEDCDSFTKIKTSEDAFYQAYFGKYRLEDVDADYYL